MAIPLLGEKLFGTTCIVKIMILGAVDLMIFFS
jgi:hypothetical protein